MMQDRTALENDLRGASDGFLMLLEEARLRERRKREVGADDPHFPDLAREIRELTEQLLSASRRQESLAHEARRFAREEEEALPRIAAIAEPEDLSMILDEWRAIERDLAVSETGSPEATDLLRRFAVMRERYARAMAARMERTRAGR